MAAAEVWVKAGEGLQGLLDTIVEDAEAVLKDSGFPTRSARFPYGMHHDYYRVRLRIGARRLSHAEVAILLNVWSSLRAERTDYARQALCGAVKSMAAADPALLQAVPQSVRKEMSAVEDGAAFEWWARNELVGLHGTLVPPSPKLDKEALLAELLGT